MKSMKHEITGFSIRMAERKDAALILRYIKDLASFENELDQVHATIPLLEENMFDKGGAEALIGEYNGESVGFAFFTTTFSTFLAKPTLFLIDLYVEPAMRGKGFGRAMLSKLASIAEERDCGRMEWWVHDWNEDAIKHYENWGAKQVEFIRVFRMTGDALDDFAKLI